MTSLMTRSAVAALLTMAPAAWAAADAREAQAQPAAHATVVNTMPRRILSFQWLQGQAAWRQSALSRLPRSTFQFASGRFALYQPDGYPAVVGRYRVSGQTVRFSGIYRLSTPPSGLTTIAVAGTLNLRTGVTTVAYQARQILVAYVNGQHFNQSKVSGFRARVVLGRV